MHTETLWLYEWESENTTEMDYIVITVYIAIPHISTTGCCLLGLAVHLLVCLLASINTRIESPLACIVQLAAVCTHVHRHSL